MLIQKGVMLGWMQEPGPLERGIVWKVKLAFLPMKRTENVTIGPTNEWDKKIRASCLQFLVMGWGMLIWLRGQGLFGRQTVVERKEIIQSVDDDTEHV
jgi:hypothetical protein